MLNRNERESKRTGIWIGIGLSLLALAGLCVRVILKINQFRKNADSFHLASTDEKNFGEKEFGDYCVASLMSNSVVDLRGATPMRDPMNLCVKAKVSNVKVYVPEDWNVKVQGNAIHSTLENHTRFDRENFEAPLLFINYSLKNSKLLVSFEPKNLSLVQEVVSEAVKGDSKEVQDVIEEVKEVVEE